jgi:hypothetical protein
MNVIHANPYFLKTPKRVIVTDETSLHAHRDLTISEFRKAAFETVAVAFEGSFWYLAKEFEKKKFDVDDREPVFGVNDL